jgi:hypothetical protein
MARIANRRHGRRKSLRQAAENLYITAAEDFYITATIQRPHSIPAAVLSSHCWQSLTFNNLPWRQIGAPIIFPPARKKMLGTEVVGGINQQEQQGMFNLLSSLQPGYTAEIGCANGASTTVIAQALEHNGKGHHFAVDPFQSSFWHDAGKVKVSAANLSQRVTFHDEFPERVFHTLPELDFVFIDGSHLFDFTIVDFVVADKRLKVGGILAFHDTWMGAVRGVLRFVLSNRAYEPFNVGPHSRPISAFRRFRHRAAIQLARLISGDSDLIYNRTPFERLALDRSNLVFIRKTGEDTRDWRFFQEF